MACNNAKVNIAGLDKQLGPASLLKASPKISVGGYRTTLVNGTSQMTVMASDKSSVVLSDVPSQKTLEVETVQ